MANEAHWVDRERATSLDVGWATLKEGCLLVETLWETLRLMMALWLVPYRAIKIMRKTDNIYLGADSPSSSVVVMRAALLCGGGEPSILSYRSTIKLS